jgi:hypothetical protein
MAYVQGRVQRCDNANGIGLATLADNLGNFASADVYGFWYTWVAYPGYRLTASAGGFYAKSHNFTESDVSSGWVTICLDATPPPQSCFTAGTLVLMASGTEAPIERIRVGDYVMSEHGGATLVVGVEQPLLGKRKLVGFGCEEPFFTEEHPFRTVTGWAAVDPAATAAENPELITQTLARGDHVVMRNGSTSIPSTNDTLVIEQLMLHTTQIEEIVSVSADPMTPLFNLLLSDCHTYFANGYLVHNKDGW